MKKKRMREFNYEVMYDIYFERFMTYLYNRFTIVDDMLPDLLADAEIFDDFIEDDLQENELIYKLGGYYA
jgi:hypothetical protein